MIPPAWQEVWICPDPMGHIQATGFDAAGRKQYRYHDRWAQRRTVAKYEQMRDFAKSVPKLRRAVRRDIDLDGMPRERALATAVRLLDLGFFRIGGEEYAETNESFGVATVRREHVTRDGEELVFDFPAKSGQRRVQSIRDPEAIAALEVMRHAAAAPTTCSAYKDKRTWHDIRSDSVNGYIQEHIGEEFSAKDFRTWSGTILAAAAARRRAEAGLRSRRQAHRRRRRQNRLRSARQHAGGLPALLHRPARLRPLPRRRDDRPRPARRRIGNDERAHPRQDREGGPRAHQLRLGGIRPGGVEVGMDLMAPLHRFDAFQQRHRALAAPLGVVKKFGDDEGGSYVSLIAYRAFFSLFPLLLLMVTILGYVLAGDDHLRHEIIDSTLSQFPVIGNQLKGGGSLRGSGVALLVGIVGSLVAGLGVVLETERAFDRVWDSARRRPPRLPPLAAAGSRPAGAAGWDVDRLDGHRQPRQRRRRRLRPLLGDRDRDAAEPGGLRHRLPAADDAARSRPATCCREVVVATVGWEVLQLLGGWFIAHQVKNATPVYGTFALVIGLLAWIHLGATFVVIGAETNVVRARRLWPRSLFGGGRGRVNAGHATARSQEKQ